jgi:hypothetical protein
VSCFEPVDDRGRLWQVRDLLPAAQAEEILSTDWTTLAVGPSRNGQESWRRLQIDHLDPVAQRYFGYINASLPEINQALGTSFDRMGGHFWIDQPGFKVAMHTDGHLSNAMQLYWTVPGPEWGTGFYRYKRQDSVLYQFPSVPNSGYIMLNHPEADGSQPLQWHAMLNPVPEGHIRVTSYWQFN